MTLPGDIDLAKGDGTAAASESDSKRRHCACKAPGIAQSGRPMMGGPRPFDLLDDRVAHHRRRGRPEHLDLLGLEALGDVVRLILGAAFAPEYVATSS